MLDQFSPDLYIRYSRRKSEEARRGFSSVNYNFKNFTTYNKQVINITYILYYVKYLHLKIELRIRFCRQSRLNKLRAKGSQARFLIY